MTKQVIIGRSGNQPFPISTPSISGIHARLTIDGDKWLLEDMDSTNGTFVRDDNTGEFKMIKSKYIKESDVIRLGGGGKFNECVFMAHHLIVESPDDYSWEFEHVIDLYNSNIKSKLDSIHKRSDYRELFAIVGPLCGCALSCLFSSPFTIRACVTVPPLLVSMIFMGTNRKIREIQELRSKILVCPKCNRPLSDIELKEKCCAKCMAHV